MNKILGNKHFQVFKQGSLFDYEPILSPHLRIARITYISKNGTDFETQVWYRRVIISSATG